MASLPFKDKNRRNRNIKGEATFLSQWNLFFRQFVKHPGMIGSVIPSSDALVARILDGVDWQNTRLFVEYGPGVGTFTRAILDRMHPDAMLMAIDLNLDFVAYLESRFADPRLKVVHGSAADVRRFIKEAGRLHADYILSGIPFSTLPAGVGSAICAETRAALRPDGAFLVYQYSRYVQPMLELTFEQVDGELEWRNIPPCRVFRATRKEEAAQAA